MVAKVLELQLQHQPSNEYSGLISFRLGSPCSPMDSQESFPQFKSINFSVLSFLYGPTLKLASIQMQEMDLKEALML